jgi:multidrug efflux pump subunit AcrB
MLDTKPPAALKPPKTIVDDGGRSWFNISAWSIRRPLPAALLFVLLMAVGLYAYSRMPVTRYPNVDIPVVMIQLESPGTPASTLEQQVAVPLEQRLKAIDGTRHVLTTIAEGFAAVTVEFSVDKKSALALADVKRVFAAAHDVLPPDLKDPRIELIEVTGPAGLTYAVRSDKLTPEQLAAVVGTKVIPEIKELPSVSDVIASGGARRQVTVQLNPRKIAENQVVPVDLSKQLAQFAVDGLKQAKGDPEEIAAALGDVPVTTGSGEKRPLKDFAAIETDAADITSFAMLNGNETSAFSVYQAPGASDVKVAEEVAAKVRLLAEANPDVTFELVDSSAPYTLGNFHSALHTLWEGAILTVLVVFLFLRNIRATIIAAIALPLSIVPAFWAMDMLGFSLNLVSLLGITIVTGILVDDAIVEIENIVRHMRTGKPPLQASIEASTEIGLTMTAISLTIIAVFVPVSFMGGIAGRFFTEFGLTVSVAVLFSLLVALLLTPVLSAYFLKPTEADGHHEGILMRGYLAVLRRAIQHRYLTVLIGFAIFAASIYVIRYLPSGFLPPEDTSRILMTVKLDDATSIDDTVEMAKKVDAIIRRDKDVREVFAKGGGAGLGADIRTAHLVIHLKPRGERDRSQAAISDSIEADLAGEKGIRFWTVNELSGQRDVVVAVVGSDGEKVAAAARDIEKQMSGLKEVKNVLANAAPEHMELRVRVKQDQVAANGVSRDAIFETIRIGTIGDTAAAIPVGDPSGEAIDVHLSLDVGNAGQAETFDSRLFQALFLDARNGKRISVDKLADATVAKGPITLNRRDGKRVVTVEADLAEGVSLGNALAAIQGLPAVASMPPDVSLKEAGDAETMRETFVSFGIAMALGVTAVLVILIILFRSVMQPITILASLPLSIAGAVFALLLFSKPLDMPVIIGLLMLVGIVTKNAIMLVDFAMVAVRRGFGRVAALMDAGHKRARPIIMTTIAMVAGMLPGALGLGEGGEFRSPMAVAVIGGLVLSTLLSLLFVPAMYTIMDDIGGLLRRRKPVS